MTPGEHRVQILKHITEQDWTSHNEINGNHILLTAVVTTTFFDREKTLSIGMHEFEKLYHAEMYLLGHFLSDNLCHPLLHLWNTGEYCKVTSLKRNPLS